MKTLAYCMLHYGQPYLGIAMASLAPQVDRFVILYTDSPSQGYAASMPCPDTEEGLKKEIAIYGDRTTWHKGSWGNEGDHHDTIWQYAEGYDWLIRFDSDEIYQPGSVAAFIEQAQATNAKHYRAPFLHFWRSFGKVCRDAQNPQRLIRVQGGVDFAYLDSNQEKYSILHMGYAQPTKYIEYKMQVQGHHSEWRPDWYTTKWLADAQTDVHPVVFDFWNAEDFDKDKLPALLRLHPYFNQEVIE